MRDDGFVGNSGGCDAVVMVGILLVAVADMPGIGPAIDFCQEPSAATHSSDSMLYLRSSPMALEEIVTPFRPPVDLLMCVLSLFCY